MRKEIKSTYKIFILTIDTPLKRTYKETEGITKVQELLLLATLNLRHSTMELFDYGQH